MTVQISHNARPAFGGRVAVVAALVWLLGAGGVLAQGFVIPPPNMGPAKEAANIKQADILDGRPEDRQAVQEVCTRCHSSVQWTDNARPWQGWLNIFSWMESKGANPTSDQVEQIYRFFQRNLVVVNANTSTVEELAPTLQVSDAVASDIVMRRAKKKFTSVADLAKVPGVDKVKLAKLKARKLLEF
jgi:hypothetical protein